MAHGTNLTDRRDSDRAIRAATTLALWTAALAHGASPDSTLHALSHLDMPLGVRADSTAAADKAGLPGPGDASGGDVDLLALLRRGAPARLALPVPGDVRGLPVRGSVVGPALRAGAAVVLDGCEIAVVPTPHHWRVYVCEPGPESLTGPPTESREEALTEHDARVLVSDALREATLRLAAIDVASARGNPRRLVDERLRAASIALPAGIPSGASSLLNEATHLDAILAVAATHESAAVTGGEMAGVDDALAPLRRAVREARRSAVAITNAALHPAATRDPGYTATPRGATRPEAR